MVVKEGRCPAAAASKAQSTASPHISHLPAVGPASTSLFQPGRHQDPDPASVAQLLIVHRPDLARPRQLQPVTDPEVQPLGMIASLAIMRPCVDKTACACREEPQEGGGGSESTSRLLLWRSLAYTQREKGGVSQTGERAADEGVGATTQS